jgi:hypothetical protein
MNTRKVATAVVAAVALAGAGVGTAVAATHGPARAHQASSESTGPDTDNLQVGDQTSPDPAAGAANAASSARIGASHAKRAAGEGNSSEGSHESDGPGGHADPAGNVDHQFNGVE